MKLIDRKRLAKLMAIQEVSARQLAKAAGCKDIAQQLLALPRDLGPHPEGGKKVVAAKLPLEPVE